MLLVCFDVGGADHLAQTRAFRRDELGKLGTALQLQRRQALRCKTFGEIGAGHGRLGQARKCRHHRGGCAGRREQASPRVSDDVIALLLERGNLFGAFGTLR